MAAVSALRKVQTPEATRTLFERTTDNDPEVQKMALVSLSHYDFDQGMFDDLQEQILSGDINGWNITSSEGLESSSRVRTIKNGPRRSLVSINPQTGRTHQIRVHLSWIGHAIVGDSLYGSPNFTEQSWTRLALHCHRLILPGIGSYVAPIPKTFTKGIECH